MSPEPWPRFHLARACRSPASAPDRASIAGGPTNRRRSSGSRRSTRGDLKNKVPFRDKIVAVEAPFTAAPVEVAKTEYRFRSLSFTEKGIALLGESDRTTRRVRTWILEAGAQPRKLWDRRDEDRYADPGTPVVRRDERPSVGGGRGGAAGPIMQSGD